MTDYRSLINVLTAAEVEFIIIGGAAAVAHGSSRLTEDLDLVYNRRRENITKIVTALGPFEPYPRGATPGPTFKWATATLQNGLNFTLTTSRGPLDLFGEITPGGTYKDLLPHTIELEIFGNKCLCLGLKRLIELKRATGRTKDRETVAELETILELQSN